MLNFYYLGSGGSQPSYDMDYKVFLKVEEAISYLKAKTGVYIDPYGTTRVYPDHLRILINFLKDSKDKDIIEFLKFLNLACIEDEVVMALGD
jgi:hypothetical protein